MTRLGLIPDLLVSLEVSDEILLRRITGRRLDPETNNVYHVDFQPAPKEVEARLIQRLDDTEEAFTARLQLYHKNLGAVVGHYKREGLYVPVKGDDAVEEVHKRG